MPIVRRYFNAIFRVSRTNGCIGILHVLLLDCGTGKDWLGTFLSLAPCRANSDEHNGRNQGPRRTTALAAPSSLPAHADDGDVRPPSHQRTWPLFWRSTTGLVADGRRFRARRLRQIRMVCRLAHRPIGVVRLHLGADPSHTRRRPPSDLGYRSRLWRAAARVACGRHYYWFDRPDGHRLGDRLPRHGRLAMSDLAPKHFRTPLARVRGRGAAKSGTQDFWVQRVTSVAGIPLTVAVFVIVIMLLGRNQAAVAQILGAPLVAIVMLLFIVCTITHMKIGMQEILVDYVPDE